jgi:hypothetical protein
MAYHITSVTNNSASIVAISNPSYPSDSALVTPGSSYRPSRAILVNTGTGNMTWPEAVGFANNIYTSADNFCIWDSGHDAIVGIGEKVNGKIDSVYYQGSAGNVQITVTTTGHLAISQAVAVMTASGG